MATSIPQQMDNVMSLSPEDRRQHLRIVEAIIFASSEPVREVDLAARLPEGTDVQTVLKDLQAAYAGRGVNLRHSDGRWAFRTAADLGFLLHHEAESARKLSRAALETLSVIAYHQPVTRGEIEEVRGVALSRGTLDTLLETGWIRLRGRRRTPGRPVTFGTTPDFLDHFGLESISDLPGLAELKESGLMALDPPAGLRSPAPNDSPDLQVDEDPLGEEPDKESDLSSSPGN